MTSALSFPRRGAAAFLAGALMAAASPSAALLALALAADFAAVLRAVAGFLALAFFFGAALASPSPSPTTFSSAFTLADMHHLARNLVAPARDPPHPARQ